MRIEWNGASAQLVASNLGKIHEQIEQSLQQSYAARESINDANPSGGNRRLTAIAEEFERVVVALRRAEEEADRLLTGSRRMIEAFEDAEREAVSIMENLELGIASDAMAGSAYGAPLRSERTIRSVVSPIRLPKPVVGPHLDIGPMGPMPKWLADNMDRYYVPSNDL